MQWGVSELAHFFFHSEQVSIFLKNSPPPKKNIILRMLLMCHVRFPAIETLMQPFSDIVMLKFNKRVRMYICLLMLHCVNLGTNAKTIEMIALEITPLETQNMIVHLSA